jgi:hypothetical protein
MIKVINLFKFLFGFWVFMLWNFLLIDYASNNDKTYQDKAESDRALKRRLEPLLNNLKLNSNSSFSDSYEMTRRKLFEDIKDVEYFIRAKLESITAENNLAVIKKTLHSTKADFQHRMK